MKKLIVIISFLISLYSCQENSAGPCEYRNFDVEITVVNVTAYQQDGKTLHHVELDFNKSDLYKEPQYLEKIRNVEIDSTYLKKNQIRPGKVYLGYVSELISGDYTPLFVSFENLFIED